MKNLKVRSEIGIKRIAILLALAALSVAWPVRASAQSSGVADYERQSRETYKKQQKEAKKAAKKQLKRIKKAEKQQRKAMKKYERAQRPQAKG